MEALEIDVELAQGSFRLAIREAIGLAGITAVFGASGSGKTTLLRIIAGLEPEARGRIAFRGEPWLDGRHSLPAEARLVSMVFQDARLFPHLDVRANLMFPIRHGKRRGAIGFDETVQMFELEAMLDRLTPSLSGGERQRVAIGRALLAAPELLLMDEPLSSLDLARKRELLPLIRSLPERFGVPILYVTHDVDELIFLATQVLVQSHGHIAARGNPREILQHSSFPTLGEIDEPGSLLEVEISGHTDSLTLARCGTSEVRLPRIAAAVGETVRLRIDPRDVILATTAPAGISIRNCLGATVRGLDRRPDGLIDVSLSVGDQMLIARITADAASDLGITPDRDIHALIKTVALNAL